MKNVCNWRNISSGIFKTFPIYFMLKMWQLLEIILHIPYEYFLKCLFRLLLLYTLWLPNISATLVLWYIFWEVTILKIPFTYLCQDEWNGDVATFEKESLRLQKKN